MKRIKVFISHSSRDMGRARELTRLLCATLDLKPNRIRCSSVPGHMLKVGSKFAKDLRREIKGCDVFIALISESSVTSDFCLFEVGAAWGLKKKICPILMRGLDVSKLHRPIADLHALRDDDRKGWGGFLHQIARGTKCQLQAPDLLLEEVTRFCGNRAPGATGNLPREALDFE